MSNQAPQFFVAGNQPTEPRRTSSLGIAAVILGSLAFLICWIPFVGAIGMPLSALGLLLGFIGLVLALTRGGVGIGFPIAGLAVSGLALFVAFSLTAAASRAIVETAKELEQRRGGGSESNQQVVVPPEQDAEKPTGPVAKEPPKAITPQWAPSNLPVRQGDVQVEVIEVKTGLVPVKDIMGNLSASTKPHLMISLRVTNQSTNRKFDYRSWGASLHTFGRNFARLTDNIGNEYNRVHFGIGEKIEGRTESESLYPGKSATDVLVFEVPVDGYEFLKLELPAQNFEGTGMLRFSIARNAVAESE